MAAVINNAKNIMDFNISIWEGHLETRIEAWFLKEENSFLFEITKADYKKKRSSFKKVKYKKKWFMDKIWREAKKKYGEELKKLGIEEFDLSGTQIQLIILDIIKSHTC